MNDREEIVMHAQADGRACAVSGSHPGGSCSTKNDDGTAQKEVQLASCQSNKGKSSFQFGAKACTLVSAVKI